MAMKKVVEHWKYMIVIKYQESPRCVVANVLDCNMVVNKFKLHSRSYVRFWTYNLGKCMNSSPLQAMS